MTWTFSESLSTPRDQVRQLIGDTNSTKPEVPDETITYYFTLETTPLAVAYRLALDLEAKYARIVEVTVDHQTTRGNQIAENYRKLATRLFADLQRSAQGATVDNSGLFVGGLSSSLGLADYDGAYDYPPLPMLDADA
jgi:hypothetical protein